MKKIYCAIMYVVMSFLLLLGGAFFGSRYFSTSRNNVISSNPTTTSSTEPVASTEVKAYRNEKLRFTIQYPSYINEIQEGSDRVTFRIKDDPGMFGSGFSVLIEKVSYNTTEEWLNAQPKGAVKNGIDKVVRLNPSSDTAARVIVSKYVVYENGDNGEPIYRKGLYVVCVKDGMLYKIPLTPSGSFGVDQDPFVSVDEVDLAGSLYVW